jgi:hypothetical protein
VRELGEDSVRGGRVTWIWRYEAEDGSPATFEGLSASEVFQTQGDAETWIGEFWQDLLASGVAQVSLLDGGRKIYGPMSLRPVD